MKSNNQHIKDIESNLFEHTEVSYKSTKNEVWEKLSNQIDFKNSSKRNKIVTLKWYKITAAATILLLIGVTLFMKYYTILISSDFGEQFSHTLPDNSKIYLNEKSELSYHPYWWSFNREINFEGEAFFQVKKGKSFNVKSEKGTTTVLGTSFNINSRKDYIVFCKTGKVLVENTDKTSNIVLTPNQIVTFQDQTKNLQNINEKPYLLSWQKQELVFESTPLIDVFSELEAIYDIKIMYSSNEFDSLNYTANYKKPSNITEVLDILSLNFNFKYSEKNKIYNLTKN